MSSRSTESRGLRRARSAAAAFAAAAFAFAGGCGSEAISDRPDLILISLDSVRADSLTFLDPERAPNLARLAQRGVVFRSAISGTSWTLPAHAELFTGQPPSLHGVESDEVAIDGRTPTLPELLRDAGYATAGFYSGWYLSGGYGFARGFREYASAMSSAAAGADAGERTRKSHEEVTSVRVTELAIAAVERVQADQPLFLFAHYFDPHYDYVPPGEWATKFDPDYAGTIDGQNFWDNPLIWDRVAKKRVVGDRDLEHLRALYQGEIAWTDHCIGQLLDALERRGRLDRTVIAVVSDHGDEFFEHANRGHRQSLYDEVVRVPFLIVPPQGAGPASTRVVDAQVALADVLPTLVDFAGERVPVTSWGRSLRSVLGASEGAPLESRPVVSSLLSFSAAGADGGWNANMIEALRKPPWKLLRRTRIAPGAAPVVDLVVLFDLESDPEERYPFFAGPPKRIVDPAVLDGWADLESELALQRARHAELAHDALSERLTDAADEFENELAGLGYLDAGPDDAAPVETLPWGVGFRPPAPLER